MKRDSMEREILAVDSGQCCEAINAPLSTRFLKSFSAKIKVRPTLYSIAFLGSNFIGETVELTFKLILLDPIEVQ